MWSSGTYEGFYEKLFQLETDDGRLAWGPELRVEQRRNIEDGGERWL